MTIKQAFINRKTDKTPIFLMRFVMSYSILLVIILFMGLYMYNIGITDSENGLYSQNNLTLESCMDNLDTIFNNIGVFTSQIAQSSHVLKLDTMDAGAPDFVMTGYNAMETLSNQLPTESMLPIIRYYVYYPDSGYCLSSSAFCTERNYYIGTQRNTDDFINQWSAMHTDTSLYMKLVDLQNYTKKDNDSYVYMIPLSTYTLSKNYNAVVCFEISKTVIESAFSSMPLYNSGIIAAVNLDNEEMFSVQGENAPDYDISTLLSLGDTDNFVKCTVNDKPMVLTTIISARNGWTYYLLQPYNMAFSSLIHYRNTFMVIIILAIFVGAAAIFLLSIRNVKPIIQMNSSLNEAINRHSSLQMTLEQQRPVIFASYLERLMLGRIYSEEEFEYIADFLNLNQKNTKYFVLYMIAYLNPDEMYTEDTITGEIDADTIKLREERFDMIKSKIYENFGDDTLIYTPKSGCYALLLRGDESICADECFNEVGERFYALHDELLTEHSIWIYGGIGNRNTEIIYTWKSYQQAREAVQYVSRDNNMQTYQHIKKDKSTYYYPLELASQLTTFINNGNESQTAEIFNLLHKENFVDRALPISMVKWFLSDLRNTMLKARFQIKPDSSNKEALEKIDSLFDEHKTFDIMRELALSLCRINDTKTTGNQLISKIQEYIRENYKDASLCLSKISDEFNISESYFSYLFKAETNKNFSEYLEGIRMEQAVVLLKTTDINISDLYLELGYNNANSFRRAFKKVYGVSPKSVRDSK